MFVLSWTDGYRIENTFFKTFKEAYDSMNDDYKNAIPEEQNELFYSDISDDNATVHCNGEEVFVWKISKCCL